MMEKFNPGGEILHKAVGYGALAVKSLVRVVAAIAMRYPKEPFATHGEHFVNSPHSHLYAHNEGTPVE